MSDAEHHRKEKARWADSTLKKALEKNGERKPQFASTSGFEFAPLYTPAETAQIDYAEQIGYPGEYPYTRGVQPSMYRGRLWTMRQYAGFGTAEESNERYRYLIEQGTTGLSVAFDLPTQMGFDSDDPRARGEVGRTGVAISSLADMEILMNEIPLDKVSTSMTINSTASILLALYVAVGEKQGVAREQLRGTVQNDLLKEYIARGTYMLPPEGAMRVITDIFAWAGAEVPNFNTISISGYHIREAGSTAVQEVAFTLADGIAYVKAALEAGLEVDKFAGRLSFFFNAHNHFIEEVAKFRAARRMWARIMRERFKAENPRSWMLRFHTQTGGSTLTAQQPLNNIARVTVQALSAVMGGTQSLHTNSYDEALALPTELSVRTALRTQQIIAHESGGGDSIDPLAGSYMVESLTDKIEAEAQAYIDKIDEMGGMVRAIELGYPQKEIQRAAYEYQMAMEREEEIVVGINQFQVEEPPYTDLLKIEQALEDKQVKRLREVKAGRSQTEFDRATAALAAAVKGGENLLPHILDCVQNYVTLGEISSILKDHYGRYEEQIVL